jgi:hypothetical protein
VCREKAGESIASKLADTNLNEDDDFGLSKPDKSAGKFAGFAELQDETPVANEEEAEDFGGLMVRASLGSQ